MLSKRGWVPASSPIDMAIEFREIDFEYGESDQLSHETNSESSTTTSTFASKGSLRLKALHQMPGKPLPTLVLQGPEKVSVQHNVHGEFTWDDFGPSLGICERKVCGKKHGRPGWNVFSSRKK